MSRQAMDWHGLFVHIARHTERLSDVGSIYEIANRTSGDVALIDPSGHITDCTKRDKRDRYSGSCASRNCETCIADAELIIELDLGWRLLIFDTVLIHEKK
jgi:hypothetical protein